MLAGCGAWFGGVVWSVRCGGRGTDPDRVGREAARSPRRREKKSAVSAHGEPCGGLGAMPANTIYYSDKYYDETFEYRCVRASCVPLLSAVLKWIEH